jgi:hypothetical protein
MIAAASIIMREPKSGGAAQRLSCRADIPVCRLWRLSSRHVLRNRPERPQHRQTGMPALLYVNELMPQSTQAISSLLDAVQTRTTKIVVLVFAGPKTCAILEHASK